MRVSIITPTKNRAAFLPRIAACVAQQTVDWEWLILDDSPAPSDFLQELSQVDARVRYTHSAEPLSIGEKRNRLIAAATGEVIAHFDDDDYYAPQYLRNMTDLLAQEQADMVKLSGFYLYAPEVPFFGYMDLNAKTGLHFELIGNQVRPIEFHSKMQIGADFIVFYGFSYVYRKAICSGAFFDDIDLCDDESFAKRVLANGHKLIATNDATRDCLHIIHPNSTARCFSKYTMPEFLLRELFPQYQP
ncbi:MAG: glycosyltransferase family 2 protein [Formosimonas sp.]